MFWGRVGFSGEILFFGRNVGQYGQFSFLVWEHFNPKLGQLNLKKGKRFADNSWLLLQFCSGADQLTPSLLPACVSANIPQNDVFSM